jgi:hypothetical protein
VLLAIDEATLRWIPGGIRGIRKPLADALNLIATADPSAVAVDITLADTDPPADADLARAL